jgi:hypothetical protein
VTDPTEPLGPLRPRERDTADAPSARRRPPRSAADDEATAQFTSALPTASLPAARRRVGAFPILITALAVVTATLLVVLVVALSGGFAPAPVASPSATPTPAAETPTPPPAEQPAPGPVVVPPSRAAEQNECVDSTGEGGAVDLAAVRLELDDRDLRVILDLTQPLPEGDAGLGIYAESANGKRSYQFATLWSNGELDEFFVHDFSSDDTDGLDRDDVEVDGSTVVLALPDGPVDRLGDRFRWYAFSTAAGVDVDACPGDALSFETLTFERPGRDG